uniref:STAS domain-containing protein n=1 Tax=Hanusia phi TaxID=3032 RepID=A0A7S0EIC5_9CRYP
MSYALVANLPPIYGLYTGSFPLIIYGLLGTSRQLAVGPVAIVSLLVSHGLNAIAPAKLEDGTANPVFIKLAIASAFLSGCFQLALGLLKLGFLTSFLSHPVVSGFTSAAAIIIGLGQLKHVLGYSLSESNNTFVVIVDMLARLGEAHYPSILMGVGVMAFLMVFKKVPRLRKVPSAMLVVIIGILISWGARLDKSGFKICGTIPAGVPVPKAPELPSSGMGTLFSFVLISSMLGYMESIAVGLTYANKNGYAINPDQELVAFGVSNIVGSFFRCYPAAGGFGRSAVNANAGSRTQMAGIISGLLMLIVLSALTPLFYYLPKPVLGAIVIIAVSGLLDTHEPFHLYELEAWEELIAFCVTFFATLLFGAELGLAVGFGCSIIALLFQTSSPTYSVLGQVPGTHLYHDLKVMDAVVPVPGILIIRFDMDLWFANCNGFRDAVLHEVKLALHMVSETDKPRGELRRLVLDLSGVNRLDSSSMRTLKDIIVKVKSISPSTSVALAGVKKAVRRRLAREIALASYMGPGAHSILVAGKSRDQLQQYFSKSADASGRITRQQAISIAHELEKFSSSKVDEHTLEEGGSEALSFNEFYQLLKQLYGEKEDRIAMLYSNVHAAVEDRESLPPVNAEGPQEEQDQEEIVMSVVPEAGEINAEIVTKQQKHA